MQQPASIQPTSAELALSPHPATDSRGRPTVAVSLTVRNVSAEGDVPAGASKGEDEARTVPVEQALGHLVNDVLPLCKSLGAPLWTASGIGSLDNAMAAHAGPNFAHWGANTTLPVSRALWRLGAALAQQPLHLFLRQGLSHKDPLPSLRTLFFMNIFNGGLHALKTEEGEVLGRDRIAIQEIMVVPVAAQSYAQAIEVGERIDAALKEILTTTYGADRVSRADEAGFSVRGLGDDDVAIAHVVAAIRQAGLQPGSDVKLALDVAASSFYDRTQGGYLFDGGVCTSAEMVAWHERFVDRYPGMVLSIEDGLHENDWAHWQMHSASMATRGVVTIGDDLFVTQLPRLRRGIAEKSAHAVLIKVNQNGTIQGTLDVIAAAYEAGMQCVVSHRSGETLDDSIADLAIAVGAMGLKSGDPQPATDFPNSRTWVRRRKYLRMAAIEDQYGQPG
jgi:enolase